MGDVELGRGPETSGLYNRVYAVREDSSCAPRVASPISTHKEKAMEHGNKGKDITMTVFKSHQNGGYI